MGHHKLDFHDNFLLAIVSTYTEKDSQCGGWLVKSPSGAVSDRVYKGVHQDGVSK